MGKADLTSTHRNNRNICLPFSQEDYDANFHDPERFRKCVDERIKLFPELFPPGITNGYLMKDIYHSKKQPIAIRRIKIAGVPYTIRPSFMMPYMTGIVDEIEKPLFFRKFNVPFWALCHVFGTKSCNTKRKITLRGTRFYGAERPNSSRMHWLERRTSKSFLQFSKSIKLKIIKALGDFCLSR